MQERSGQAPQKREDGSRAFKLRQNSGQDLDGAKVEKAVSSFTNKRRAAAEMNLPFC